MSGGRHCADRQQHGQPQKDQHLLAHKNFLSLGIGAQIGLRKARTEGMGVAVKQIFERVNVQFASAIYKCSSQLSRC
jgi:hypothetical protein